MPHRVIREGFIRSHSLQQVSRDARLTMALLILAVDDHGRMEASPAHLKADLYPLDEDVTGYQIWNWVDELAEQGSVAWYEVGGRPYIHLPNWEKHDSKRRKCVSAHPEPPPVAFPKVSETIENTTHGVGVGVGLGLGEGEVLPPPQAGPPQGDDDPVELGSGWTLDAMHELANPEPVAAAPAACEFPPEAAPVEPLAAEGDPSIDWGVSTFRPCEDCTTEASCSEAFECILRERLSVPCSCEVRCDGPECACACHGETDEPPPIIRTRPAKPNRKPKRAAKAVPDWAWSAAKRLYGYPTDSGDTGLSRLRKLQGTEVTFARHFAAWSDPPPHELLSRVIDWLCGQGDFEGKGNPARGPDECPFAIWSVGGASGHGFRGKWDRLLSAVERDLAPGSEPDDTRGAGLRKFLDEEGAM